MRIMLTKTIKMKTKTDNSFFLFTLNEKKMWSPMMQMNAIGKIHCILFRNSRKCPTEIVFE